MGNAFDVKSKVLCMKTHANLHNIVFNKIICIVLATQESSVAPFELTKKRKGKGLR